MITSDMPLVWIIIGYLLGSIPFSALVTHYFVKVDLSQVGDGNPGAANAWKAGGWRIGAAALVLDYLKGAVPVSLAHYAFGIDSWALMGVALSPVVGHAWPVFNRFRGGKALAVTFGIWTGLTLAEGPLVLGLAFVIGIVLLKEHGWTVILGMVVLLAFLVFRGAAPSLLVAWAANMAILIWKHWTALHFSLPKIVSPL